MGIQRHWVWLRVTRPQLVIRHTEHLPGGPGPPILAITIVTFRGGQGGQGGNCPPSGSVRCPIKSLHSFFPHPCAWLDLCHPQAINSPLLSQPVPIWSAPQADCRYGFPLAPINMRSSASLLPHTVASYMAGLGIRRFRVTSRGGT